MNTNTTSKEVILPAPLFRDPIYDSPTDPMVIWNRDEKKWYMFYTQRRAEDESTGVAWVHGTKIGIAESEDGAKWLYRGTLENLDFEHGHNTFWAPEIVWAEGKYHMFVSYITGIPIDWEYPRQMLHYTSDNLWDWKFEGPIDLGSTRVIDACLYETAPHHYKIWYKNENDDSHTWTAESDDLYTWKVNGPEITDCSQEGPNVFELGGIKWMISDYWKGLAVYRSDDCTNWKRCSDILNDTGSRPMDQGLGHHADVLVIGERAFIFYFTHPFEKDENRPKRERDKAMVQCAELFVKNGELFCDRNAEVHFPQAEN